MSDSLFFLVKSVFVIHDAILSYYVILSYCQPVTVILVFPFGFVDSVRVE